MTNKILQIFMAMGPWAAKTEAREDVTVFPFFLFYYLFPEAVTFFKKTMTYVFLKSN